MTGPEDNRPHQNASDPDISEALLRESFGTYSDALASIDPVKTQILDPEEYGNVSDLIRKKLSEEEAVRWAVKKVATPSPDSPTPLSNQITNNDYILHQIIGKGGFGEVWEAIQTSLGRSVALKYLRKDLFEEAKNDESRGRALDVSFRQEALATANLEHPNIIPVHEVGVDQEGRPLIAMKRIGGRCWQDILDEDFSLMPYREYLGKHLPVLMDVSQAVAFAHSRGIVHRDIKPSQVMVGEFGEVVLMDWGLAVLYDESLLTRHAPGSVERDIPTLTTASNPAGTLAFMAPEQTEKHAKDIGPHTDVYLLGGLLYYILTGKTPHDPDSVSQAFNQARKGIVRPMEESPFGNEIPPPLVFIATQAMAPEPEERIPSALGFIEELQNYLTGASKREESRHLTASVLEQLSNTNIEYAELSDLLSQIAQARILDPGNEEAVGAEQILRKRYAERALRNQDYVLARIQALRLEDDRQRHHYLEKSNHGERRLQKQNYYQRLISLLLSLILVWAGTTFYFVNSDMESNHRVDREFVQAREHYMEQKIQLFEVLPLKLALIDDEEEIVSEAASTWNKFVESIRDLLEYATQESFDSEARLEKTDLARTVESQLQFFESVNLPDGINHVEDLKVFNSDSSVNARL